jgi:hypothetical protein
MTSEVSKLHVDTPGDYVLVPEEEFNSLVRALELLTSEEFQKQFEKSSESKGTSLKQLKAKYGTHRSEELVTVSLPKDGLETLIQLIEDLRFTEETQKIREEYGSEDYISLSEFESEHVEG